MALISGGGAGHEPMHGGFVGQGRGSWELRGGTKAAEIAVGEASKNGDVYGAKINVYSIYR